MKAARADARSVGALAAVLIVATGLALWSTKGVTFRGDEWSWLFNGMDLSADAILRDHNGHLVAFTHAVFGVLPEVVGLGHYWVFRVLALSLHLAVVVLVWLLARRAVGSGPAVAPAAVVALLGTGADAFLSAFTFGMAAAMAACLGALVLVSRGGTRSDLGACALLTAGLASFSVAVPFAVGMAVELLLRDRGWRRLWIPLVPLALDAIWRIGWGGGAGDGAGGPLDVLAYLVQAAGGAVAGLAGLQLASPTLAERAPWLDLFVAVVTVALAALLARHLALGRGTPRLANLTVTALVLWLLIAVGRGEGGDPYASRYVYEGAVILALIAAEVLPREVLQRRPLRRVFAVAVAASVALNVAWLAVWAEFLRDESVVARAQLAGLEVAGDSAPREYRPTNDFALRPVTAGLYADARADYGGSAAMTLPELRRARPAPRAAADAVLIPIAGVRLEPGSRRPAGSGCSAVRQGAPTEVLARASGALIARAAPAKVTLGLRRFGEQFTPIPPPPDGPAYILTTPLGEAPDPWRLRVTASGPVQVCPLP